MIFYRLSLCKASNAKLWQICANKSLARFPNPHPAANRLRNKTSKSLALLIFKIKELGLKLPWKAWWWTNIKVLWQKWNWFQDKVHRVLQGLRWSPARSSFETSQTLKNWKWKLKCKLWLKHHILTKDSWTSEENVHHSYVLLIGIVVSLPLYKIIHDKRSISDQDLSKWDQQLFLWVTGVLQPQGFLQFDGVVTLDVPVRWVDGRLPLCQVGWCRQVAERTQVEISWVTKSGKYLFEAMNLWL